MDLGLANRVALVTGASAGLGLAIARELSQEGASVAIAARREDLLKQEAAAISAATKQRVLPVPGDVTISGEAERIARAAGEALGPIDILVANAGGPPSTLFATTTEAQYLAALQLNLVASINLARACVPGMRERKWGRVIFLASFVAKMPMVGLILSNTARAGLLGFAKTLANEVARDGVTVNSLLPGHYDTQRAIDLATMRATREGKAVADVLAARTVDIPMGRSGDPREFAAVAAFLASERASFLTGTAIQVDGGQVPTIT
jgi:3-oxoacyl-[acyl-carrier protein] reductase